MQFNLEYLALSAVLDGAPFFPTRQILGMYQQFRCNQLSAVDFWYRLSVVQIGLNSITANFLPC